MTVDALSAKYMVPIRRGIMSVFMMRDGERASIRIGKAELSRDSDHVNAKTGARGYEPDIYEVGG